MGGDERGPWVYYLKHKTSDAVKPVFRKWGYNVKEVQDESVR